MESFFVSQDEFIKFNSYHLRRYLRKSADLNSREPLTDVIGSRIRSITKRTALDFYQEANVVKAERNDGLSWACEELSSFLQDSFSQWHICNFVGSYSKNELPEIAKWVGIRNLFKSIKKAKLSEYRVFPSVTKIIILFLSAIVLTVIGNLSLPKLNDIIHNISNNIGSLPANIILILSITAIPVVIGIIISNIKLENNIEVTERIIEALKKKRKLKEYENVIEEIAYRFLMLNLPKCVIIDDFSRLDQFTQDVLVKSMTLTSIRSSIH